MDTFNEGDEIRRPVQVGALAPAFSVSAVSQDGAISLDDYKGRNALLLGLFRGVYCPFCRRQLAIFSEATDRIRSLHIESVAVITTPALRARAYLRHFPASMPIASDPEMNTHRAYGVPQPAPTKSDTNWPATLNSDDVKAVRTDHTWPDITVATTLVAAAEMLDAKDSFQKTPADLREEKTTWRQLAGLVLIDEDGIVRWTDFEASDGVKSFGNIAGVPEIVAAARRIGGRPQS